MSCSTARSVSSSRPPSSASTEYIMYAISVSYSLTCLLPSTGKKFIIFCHYSKRIESRNRLPSAILNHPLRCCLAALHMHTLWLICVVICPNFGPYNTSVMTERTRLISYLLYGLFGAILKKNIIKTPDVIFNIPLHAQEVIRGRVH